MKIYIKLSLKTPWAFFFKLEMDRLKPMRVKRKLGLMDGPIKVGNDGTAHFSFFLHLLYRLGESASWKTQEFESQFGDAQS